MVGRLDAVANRRAPLGAWASIAPPAALEGTPPAAAPGLENRHAGGYPSWAIDTSTFRAVSKGG